MSLSLSFYNDFILFLIGFGFNAKMMMLMMMLMIMVKMMLMVKMLMLMVMMLMGMMLMVMMLMMLSRITCIVTRPACHLHVSAKSVYNRFALVFKPVTYRYSTELLLLTYLYSVIYRYHVP